MQMWLDSGWTYDPNGGFKILMYIQNIHQILWAIFMIFNRDSSALGSDDSSSDAESDSEAGEYFAQKCVFWAENGWQDEEFVEQSFIRN